MTISEKDIKKLWGLAAGRCSKPGCGEECIKFLDSQSSIVVGEMAHIIAKKPKGPRGKDFGGEDTYENLILLCPTHHREVDKAPEVYPPQVLYEWKKMHEEKVRKSFLSPKYENIKQLAHAIKKLLIENKTAWLQYGPESLEAKQNPISSAYKIWILKKLDTIVPNNRKIINIIKQNRDLFNVKDFEICNKFIQHAEGFERNCYIRTEGVPRFPKSFEEMIDRYVEI